MPGNFAQYRQLAKATSLPLTISERIGGKLQFQSLLDARAAKYVMFDVCWCGGLTEARKITAMADAHQLSCAPHTAGGPLRFYEHDWPLMLENPLMPKDGHIEAPDLPGFGMQIKPEAWNYPRAIRRVSRA
jgi:galactonate dehydratase